MFEGKVAEILNKQLGAFVEGLDAKALNIGVWSGQIVLENLQVRLVGKRARTAGPHDGCGADKSRVSPRCSSSQRR